MIVITAATGQLGRLVIDHLLARGVPARQVTAAVRSPEKAADLAVRGVQVRRADYDSPATLKEVFAGADRVLLVSGTDLGGRAGQHRAAVDAAREAGVGLLAYTSIADADRSTLGLAVSHRDTEQAVRESGLPFTLLRNGWYTENALDGLAGAVERGVFVSNMGGGRIAYAARTDVAEAAAVVLAGGGHGNATYELTGDTALSMADIAAEASRQTGRQITHRHVPDEQYAEILAGAGLPGPIAGAYVDAGSRIREGALAAVTADLRTLIGRPTTPITESVATALRGLAAAS